MTSSNSFSVPYIKQEPEVNFYLELPSCESETESDLVTIQKIRVDKVPKSRTKPRKGHKIPTNNVNVKDPQQDDITCDVCFKAFNTRVTLTRYKKSHLSRITCEICSRSFAVSHIKKHLKLHEMKEKDPEFKCPECNKCYFTKGHLYIHLKTHKKMFECDLCTALYGAKATLSFHVLKHVSAEEFERIQSEFFTCDICQKKCINNHSLKQHKQVHKGKIQCAICNQSLTQQSMKSHLKTHKLKERGPQFYCNICSKSFVWIQYLKAHLKTHIKEYECDICEMKFSDRLQVSEHIMIHLDNQIFKCDVCGKIVSSSTVLKKHKKSHETKVECLTCGKTLNKFSHEGTQIEATRTEVQM